MKKKIISLFLLIAMLVGVLASCGYSFSEDDMGQYVSIKADDLKSLLLSLEIDDADFTTNEETRLNQVHDAVATALANLSISNKQTSGKADGNDVVYYHYFIVDGDASSYATPEALAEHTYVAYNSSKKTSLMTGSATNVVLGLKEIEDDSFTKKFYEAIAGFEFVKSKDAVADDPATKETDETAAAVIGNLYEIITSSSTTEEKKTKITRDDVIYVTYTKKWTVTDSTGKQTNMSKTYTDIRVWDTNHLDDTKDAADPFFAKFVGKTVGSLEQFDLTEGEGDDAIKYTYSGITINGIVKAPITGNKIPPYGSPIQIKYNPYIENEQTKLTAVDGSSIELKKDKELTYFVYPVYFTDTKPMEKVSVEDIMGELFGSSIKVDMFTEEALAYKTSYVAEEGKAAVEKTLKEIIAGDSASTDPVWKESLADIYKYISDATKHADYNKELDGKKENDKPVKNSKEEIKARYEGYRDTRMKHLETLTNGKTGEDKLGANAILAKEFETYNYETLKDAYYSEIEHSVQHALLEKIKAIDVKALPEEAVEDVYEILYENEKYNFNNNSVTDKNDSNYGKALYSLYDNFDAYLIATYAKGKTIEDATAAIREEAKTFVKLSVQLYYTAEVYGVKITDEDVENITDDYYDYYSEYGIRLAVQLDKLFNHLLYMKGEEDFYKKEENSGKTYDLQLDDKNNIEYAVIKYVLKGTATE